MKASFSRCLPGLMVALLCLPRVTFGAPPVITSQPTNQAVTIGGTAVFAVTATGLSLAYQWRFNMKNLSGETQSSLTLTNVQPANAGAYSVIVQSRPRSTTSSNAVLMVGSPPAITIQPTNQTAVVGATTVSV